METRKVGIFVNDTIDGLRNGTIEDKEGWVVPVKALETV
jgi:hypothetical protein